eukprot:XP_011661425.1 PREDICTED: uncharacterized protein LOC100893067 [Strongylocentrotus purpuratus]
MIIMHPVQMVSSLCVLTLSVLLALRFGRVMAEGEPVSITLKCGDIKNLTSPKYPGNYNNNLRIHWDVRADLAQRIVVIFNDFHTEVGDFLYVEEEYYPSARAKYSGSNAATPYISFGNHLMIIFISDITESRTGFHLFISCLNETDDTGFHEAFEGLEHTRVLTQPVCKDAWHTDVADTVCREAGFPGSYETNFTSETENISESKGINYQCSRSTFRLQDCKISTSRCIAQVSLVIVCNVLSKLGCFDLAEYTHLLSRSVKLSRDQCLTHCKALSTTPQYAVHQPRTNCSCINQTALDVTKLTQVCSRCRTNSESQTGHYATLFNVSFGFCNKPPELDNGFWSNTLNGFMYGTTITAKCNDSYELVGKDRKMRCDKATTSTTQDFVWHGTIPSCRKTNTSTLFPSTTLLQNVPVNGKYLNIKFCCIIYNMISKHTVAISMAIFNFHFFYDVS